MNVFAQVLRQHGFGGLLQLVSIVVAAEADPFGRAHGFGGIARLLGQRELAPEVVLIDGVGRCATFA